MNYILGIDIGTGSTKAIAMAEGGKVLATAQRHYGIKSPQPGFNEQDADMIWQRFVECVREVDDKLQNPPVAISLSCAMHSFIAVDDNGNALIPMMTWADTRAAEYADKLRSSAEGEKIYRATGTAIHGMSPLFKLLWLRDHDPRVFNSARKFVSIKEYIWFKLFGVFEVDHAVASATGLFDIAQLTWNNDACKLAGIDAGRLSTPVGTNYIRSGISASAAAITGLPLDVKFIAGGSDGVCANVGSFVTEPGTAALTIGTSGAVRVTGPGPVFDKDAMIFNYRLTPDTLVSGGAVNNGGIAVNWLIKNFLNKTQATPTDYDALFATVDIVSAGSDGLLFLPYLYGERAPIWDAEASASFLNIKPSHTQKHFLRAGIEGVCYALNDVLKYLEASGQAISQINISGGFISSPVWVQILADITGKKLVVHQPEDASAIGAIYMAAQALYGTDEGYKASTDDAVAIAPDMQKHKVYQQGFEQYRRFSKLLTRLDD